jgi:UDP-glucose 4-epimerase
MNVLITGGLGYIGSYLTVELLSKNYNVFVIDNGSNCDRLQVELGIQCSLNNILPDNEGRLTVYDCDMRHINEVREVFGKNKFDVVIHLAGFKSVYESFQRKDDYIHNNVKSTEVLLNVMKEYGVLDLIFSSSCTVYGDGIRGHAFSEDDPFEPKSPYAISKTMCEQMILQDKYVSSVIFRYFNPVGYHPSGYLYEYPPPKKNLHNNLFYEISQVLLGNKPKLSIYGDCFDTCDGTAERNYFDMYDLSRAHEIAFCMFGDQGDHEIYNLGPH